MMKFLKKITRKIVRYYTWREVTICLNETIYLIDKQIPRIYNREMWGKMITTFYFFGLVFSVSKSDAMTGRFCNETELDKKLYAYIQKKGVKINDNKRKNH